MMLKSKESHRKYLFVSEKQKDQKKKNSVSELAKNENIADGERKFNIIGLLI